MESVEASLNPEHELLLNMAGYANTIAFWGGWITAGLEGLRSQGLVRQACTARGVEYQLTDKGVSLAKEIACQPSPTTNQPNS